jgi:two-component system response regulator QseB
MIGASLQQGLRDDGYAVDWVKDGRAAEVALADPAHQLVLLDLGLPHKDGLTLLRALRKRGSRVPVLVLTARDAIEDRVQGLDAGADDYLVKPFSLAELAARMRALLRRDAGRADPVVRVGSLTLDPSTREVTRDGKPVTLSAREFALLEAAVLSRSQLEEKLYGWGQEVESNTVEVYIHALRRKLGQDFIKNVRGVGYMVPKAS